MLLAHGLHDRLTPRRGARHALMRAGLPEKVWRPGASIQGMHTRQARPEGTQDPGVPRAGRAARRRRGGAGKAEPRVAQDPSRRAVPSTQAQRRTPLSIWQTSAELVGIACDHAPWMTVQMQRGRSPLVPKPSIVMLKRVAGMISGKGGIPGVNVVSVTTSKRIVIHQANLARADSSSQCSEHRQRAECGQHR